jgi:hypothetical protein
MTNPYDAQDFHAKAIAAGRHRAIVGGRWEETGRVQMQLLLDNGLMPHHHLLDIGAGALRLGCKAVPYLDPGHYHATDASRALLLTGRAQELPDPERLPEAHLVEDGLFDFPGIPETITHAIAFAVFPHLPMVFLRRALANLGRFPDLETVIFTVFLAPDAMSATRPYRQADGVVTHDLRPPYHVLPEDVSHMAAVTGWSLRRDARMLPRGQVAFIATSCAGAEKR